MSVLALIVALMSATPLRAADARPIVTGTVTRVVDGDTIDVQLASGVIRVRLYGIDAPEHNQGGGAESSAALRSLVADKRVDLEPFSQDRYDRMIALVSVGEVDANAEMVRRGHAWAYRKYMKRSDAALCTLEADARSAHRGLWAAPARDTLAPWEFRHRSRLDHLTDYSRETAGHCIATIGSKATSQP